jgi:dienelactone hydrolase
MFHVDSAIRIQNKSYWLVVAGTICALTFFNCGASSEVEQWVEFKSAPVDNPGSESILGALLKPSGAGPFPAVIIAHGCFGIEANHHDWARRLNEWGYVAFIVDSFTTRNESSVCESPKKVSPRTRANDIYGAAAHLRQKAFVDPDSIGMIGFSHGGWTALYVAQEYLPKKVNESPFQAIVAFYPWCEKRNLKQTNVPLLILAGTSDTWTPVDRCRKMIKSQRANFKKNILLIEYDNAYHGFDDPDFEKAMDYDGYTIKFDPNAAQFSIKETKEFLARNLIK